MGFHQLIDERIHEDVWVDFANDLPAYTRGRSAVRGRVDCRRIKRAHGPQAALRRILGWARDSLPCGLLQMSVT